MKRIAVWAFYGIGALAIGYLALYTYAAVTGRNLQPGDPIHIFRKPDAPNYSFRAVAIPTSLRANGSREMPVQWQVARSSPEILQELDCFAAEFIIGPAEGRTRWLPAMAAVTCLITPSRRRDDIRWRLRV